MNHWLQVFGTTQYQVAAAALSGEKARRLKPLPPSSRRQDNVIVTAVFLPIFAWRNALSRVSLTKSFSTDWLHHYVCRQIPQSGNMRWHPNHGNIPKATLMILHNSMVGRLAEVWDMFQRVGTFGLAWSAILGEQGYFWQSFCYWSVHILELQVLQLHIVLEW